MNYSIYGSCNTTLTVQVFTYASILKDFDDIIVQLEIVLRKNKLEACT